MANAKDQAEALAALRALRIKPGETVYTIVRAVSRSGMQRSIDCYIMRKNKPVWIGWNMSRVLGYRWSDRDRGMMVSGCGMDMCFAVVYDLGATLWPKGTRNGEPDTSGGYALKKHDL